MRSNCAVYVDVGYLIASAATRVTGTSLRNGIAVDYPALLEALVAQAEVLTALPVLRVHWYDAATNGIPDQEQERIGLLPRVKLRLGRFGFDGQQKGVDLRIGLDLVAHARNGAIDTIVLLSGDDDLTEAVEEAQVHGVQVILLAVPNEDGLPHGVSRHLQRAADSLEVLDPRALESTVHSPTLLEAPPLKEAPGPTTRVRVPTPSAVAEMIRTRPSGLVAYSGTTGLEAVIAPEFSKTDEEVAAAIDQVAVKALDSFLASASASESAAFELGRPSIPRDLDRALLLDLSDALSSYNLSDTVRTQLRRRFWEIADDRV